MSTNRLSRQVAEILRAAKIDAEVKGYDWTGAVKVRAHESLYGGIEALMIGHGLNVWRGERDLYIQNF